MPRRRVGNMPKGSVQYGFDLNELFGLKSNANAAGTAPPKTATKGFPSFNRIKRGIFDKVSGMLGFSATGPSSPRGVSRMAGNVDRVIQNIWKRKMPTFNRFLMRPSVAWGAGFVLWGTGAMLSTMGTQISKTIKMRRIDRPSALRQGPGYISWGKTSGMPSNNLSTDGLSLSLSNLRHSSIV